ncbi:MAG: GNAT family N-acetyltransferase [Armatimonadota bacterium]|nr:GNAT family N-acetyltransferase [Armatimonadota bacterium]
MIVSSPSAEVLVRRAPVAEEFTAGESNLLEAGAREAPLLTFNLARSQVVVRPLEWADVRALEWHGGPDLRAFYEDQWVQHSSGLIYVLVADFNRFPIGQLAIHWQGKPTHPAIPDVQSLRVFAAFQGLGIGTRLLQVSEKIVAEHGLRHVSLAVALHNEAARRLYERLHYRMIGEPYVDTWEYTDAQGQLVRIQETVVDMVKSLEGARADNNQ